jgi:hypothetical protein
MAEDEYIYWRIMFVFSVNEKAIRSCSYPCLELAIHTTRRTTVDRNRAERKQEERNQLFSTAQAPNRPSRRRFGPQASSLNLRVMRCPPGQKHASAGLAVEPAWPACILEVD